VNNVRRSWKILQLFVLNRCFAVRFVVENKTLLFVVKKNFLFISFSFFLSIDYI